MKDYAVELKLSESMVRRLKHKWRALPHLFGMESDRTQKALQSRGLVNEHSALTELGSKVGEQLAMGKTIPVEPPPGGWLPSAGFRCGSGPEFK